MVIQRSTIRTHKTAAGRRFKTQGDLTQETFNVYYFCERCRDLVARKINGYLFTQVQSDQVLFLCNACIGHEGEEAVDELAKAERPASSGKKATLGSPPSNAPMA